MALATTLAVAASSLASFGSCADRFGESITHAAPKLSLADVDDAPAPRRGVVVIAAAETSASSTWPIALAVYADASIRPSIDDGAARVLAGEPGAAKTPVAIAELAELRSKVHGVDVASRAILAEVARRTRAKSIVVVFPAHDDAPVEARIWDAADDRLDATAFRADVRKEGASWGALVDVVHARYGASGASNGTSSLDASSSSASSSKSGDEKKSTFLASPWLWGAVGAALVGALVVYAATRDSGTSPAPVRVDWSK